MLLPARPSCMEPTSKRGVLVRLKASTLNRKACLSVSFQFLLTEASMLNVPGPRKLLRSPDSPGRAARNWLMAELGSFTLLGLVNTFGWPLIINVPVFGRFPFKTAKDCSSKLVAQPNPLLIENGYPE